MAPGILAVSSVSTLTQRVLRPILFNVPIPGWQSVYDDDEDDRIKGFIVPTAGLYLIQYNVNGLSTLERNGIVVPGINSTLIELTAGDIISMTGVKISQSEVNATATIIFIKLS